MASVAALSRITPVAELIDSLIGSLTLKRPSVRPPSSRRSGWVLIGSRACRIAAVSSGGQSWENDLVTTCFAAYADLVIKEAFLRWLPIAAIAVAFGVVYWLFRRRAAAREAEKRKEWLNDRREKRGGGKPPPPSA
jgi:hypothetical protein